MFTLGILQGQNKIYFRQGHVEEYHPGSGAFRGPYQSFKAYSVIIGRKMRF